MKIFYHGLKMRQNLSTRNPEVWKIEMFSAGEGFQVFKHTFLNSSFWQGIVYYLRGNIVLSKSFKPAVPNLGSATTLTHGVHEKSQGVLKIQVLCNVDLYSLKKTLCEYASFYVGAGAAAGGGAGVREHEKFWNR
jgi:hypothetical protein